ncbi:MAG: alpha/beta hydrolase [Actinomycetota bacterium]|nr:alpha/beta hydrolase [Actinomycetota bacterium]
MTAVILLPGIGVPAHVAYAPLMAELAHSSPVVPKELEVYAGDQPPQDYGLDLEVDGIDRFATDQGFDRFHLFGHSIGGAIALAYVGRHPDRVASVALNEPGTDFSDADRAPIAVEQLSEVPEDQRVQWFVQHLVRPDVELPPPPPSGDPEMAKRPAGFATAIPAMSAYRVDEDDLRRYRGPAYFAYGTLSNEMWEAMAERIPHVLGDCTVERYEGRHHLDAPHQAEPRRLAAALTTLWKRADG